jgi:hypothetical protein
MLFQCHLPRAVWFTSQPPIHVSNLPNDDDDDDDDDGVKPF